MSPSCLLHERLLAWATTQPEAPFIVEAERGIANAIVWLSTLTGGHTFIPTAPDAPAQEMMRIAALFPPNVVIVKQEESLRAHCAEYLSQHKIPATFTAIDALQRTQTGKIDRQSLRWQATPQQVSGANTHAA